MRSFTADLSRHFENITGENMREYSLGMLKHGWMKTADEKRVGKIKTDIYWNKKYYYGKGSAKTSWNFIWKIFYKKALFILCNKVWYKQLMLFYFS